MTDSLIFIYHSDFTLSLTWVENGGRQTRFNTGLSNVHGSFYLRELHVDGSLKQGRARDNDINSIRQKQNKYLHTCVLKNPALALVGLRKVNTLTGMSSFSGTRLSS
jgi:hypothetical protein